MKRLFIWVLYSLVIIGCAKPQDIVLTFNVSNPTAGEVVLICHSEMKTYPLDSAGTAVAVIDGTDAAYVQVWYGRGGRKIFIERGDRAVISFDGADMDGTFSFEGDKTEAVNIWRMSLFQPFLMKRMRLISRTIRKSLTQKGTMP